jgi:hypothetical protein
MCEYRVEITATQLFTGNYHPTITSLKPFVNGYWVFLSLKDYAVK